MKHAIFALALLLPVTACQGSGDESGSKDNALKTFIVEPKEKARATGKASDERYKQLEEQASELDDEEEDADAER